MTASTARFVRDLWTMAAVSTTWLAALIAWLCEPGLGVLLIGGDDLRLQLGPLGQQVRRQLLLAGVEAAASYFFDSCAIWAFRLSMRFWLAWIVELAKALSCSPRKAR